MNITASRILLEDFDEGKIRKDRQALLNLLAALDEHALTDLEKKEVEKMSEGTGEGWTGSFVRQPVGLDFSRAGGLLDRKSKEFEEKDAATKAAKLEKRAAFAKKAEKDNSMISKADNR
jgi:hypothetical protein